MSDIPGPVRAKGLRRAVGWGVGIGLLGLAVGYALAGADFAVIGQAPRWMFASLAGLVLVNLLLTAGLFWSVTRSFAAKPAVGFGTMSALIAVSGVLNTIPIVRAGLWGRAAYLKKYHGLAVRDSVVILGVVFALAAVVLGSVSLIVLVVSERSVGRQAMAAAIMQAQVLMPILAGMTVVSPWIASRLLQRPTVGAWMWVPLRSLDLAAAAGRLWLAFGVVGVELTWTDAVLLASANLIVKLVGLTPNGLGLSEWVIAALSAAMMPIETATAAAAALVDRTVEVVVMLVAGAAGAVWLKRETSKRVLTPTTESAAY